MNPAILATTSHEKAGRGVLTAPAPAQSLIRPCAAHVPARWGHRALPAIVRFMGSAALLSTLLLAFSAVAQEAGRPGRPDYSSFRIIAERNIFNANRSGRPVRTVQEAPRPRRVDTFTLVGTMDYRKGPFAFFDGTSSDFRKILPPGSSIAGYKIAEIVGGQVKLEAATNRVALKVGMQLRREDQGPWELRERVEEYTSASSQADSGRGDLRGSDSRRGDNSRRGDSRGSDSRRGESRMEEGRTSVPLPPATAAPGSGLAAPSSAAEAAPSPEELEILRRLMEQRERELR